jgi:hypothetical protein
MLIVSRDQWTRTLNLAHSNKLLQNRGGLMWALSRLHRFSGQEGPDGEIGLRRMLPRTFLFQSWTWQ